MRRFVRYLLLHAAVVGSLGYLQATGFDWDGVRTGGGPFGFRGSTPSHK